VRGTRPPPTVKLTSALTQNSALTKLRMADFTGKYKLVSQQNLDQLAKVLGIPDEIAKEAVSLDRTMEIKQSGDNYEFKHTGKSKTLENKFKLGDEFTENALGVDLKAKASRDGNKLVTKIQTPKGEVVIVRELKGNDLVATTTGGGVTAVSKFVKA